jgi:hypothetical protein
MAKNPDKSPRRRGRPSKEEEVRRALVEIGCDPALVDPRRVLASIAGDTDAPAGARVAACRTLLGLSEGSDARMVAEDTVAERAIRLMAAARKAH